MKSVDARAAKDGAVTAARLVRLQLEAHRTLLERADGTTRLAVALIGGIALITGYILTTGLLDLLSSTLILLSVLIALAGIFGSLRVAVGTLDRRVLELGPDLKNVQRQVSAGQTETEAHLCLIRDYSKAFVTNWHIVNNRSRLLVVASYFLATSTTLFLTALVYILGGVIYA